MPSLKTWLPALTIAIKLLSTVLITAALGLELWMYLTATPLRQTTSLWWWVISWGRLALMAHGLEAIAAIAIAATRQRSPLSAGVYTFFTGTVGLVELWRSDVPSAPRSALEP